MNWFSKISNNTSSGVRLWLDDVRDPSDPQIQRDFGHSRALHKQNNEKDNS